MIVANLATYPARRAGLGAVVAALLPQVDRLNLVLNQFDAALSELPADPKLRQIVPDDDTKDAGKFYPDTAGASWVFLVDDDIRFPPDFTARSISAMEALPQDGARGRWLGGYHGSVYRPPAFSLAPKRLMGWLRYREDRIADYRRPYRFREALAAPVVVDQIATNTAVVRGRDLPPYAYMKDSQKFVDVRLARWCFEQGITPVCLPRAAGWLGETRYDETIFRGFTRANPPHVAREIWSYATRREGLGEEVRGWQKP